MTLSFEKLAIDLLTGLELSEKLPEGGHHLLYGITGSQRALMLAGFTRATGGPVLYVAANLRDAETLLADYEFFTGKKGYLFPSRPVMAGEADAESQDLEFQRLTALEQVMTGQPCLVAAAATALLEPLPPLEHLLENQMVLRPGLNLDPLETAKKLTQMGYQRTDKVEAPGQFSLRGDILDVVTTTSDQACRLQFFDVQIESLRTIDIDSQRSTGTLEQLRCMPARMALLDDDVRKNLLKKLSDVQVPAQFQGQLNQDRERFEHFSYWAGYQSYIQYMFSRVYTLPEYFTNGLVVAGETSDLFGQLELLGTELLDRQKNLLEAGKLLPDLQPYVPLADLAHRWQKTPTCHLGLLLRAPKQFKLNTLGSIPFRQVPSFYGQQNLLSEELGVWAKRKATVIIVTPASGQQLKENLFDNGIDSILAHTAIVAGQVNIVRGSLSSGFELLDPPVIVLTHGEIAPRRVSKLRQPRGMSAGDIQALKPGEYIVHSNHGIGQFIGVVTREIGGTKRDYLYIKYAGKDKLYLPTDQVQHLQRYIGGQDKPPKLYALGGGDWQRVKKKVRESVQQLAFDLLQLYARRRAARGHAFGPDTPWQQELENNFPWQETPDQLRVIQEVKADMESVRPMDRLLCGDVGYGKTEVALRAAMKAVMDGKQVAVLAPTTVLAQQHFRTFSERMAPFPIKIEVLSRFKTPQQQAQIVHAANAGAVDIIIGTHRLLQKDLLIPQLGLLVVDEEQRFGVGHKEQIKQIRANIDVLTMTATPIPRTLHMALLGVRDLSIINTPPEGRFPVQTYVMEYSDQLTVSAVRRELDRGGQVYLVYNRVQGIDTLAGRLRRLLPEVEIAVIHGQMPEGLMEKAMIDFYEGRYHVLLSTTIIENGLDLPNVNTVLVYDADRLGLSQLYQLRGRVGRGRRLASAYCTYRRDKVLSEKAQKRLAAIKEFTELGSGYKIALKDLEIRGAGNILGPEQHGYISAVGFDLYCQLLEERVRELTGQEVVSDSVPDVLIELPINAYIPETYLPEQEKIYVYRRVRDSRTIKDLDELEAELTDRFGDMPDPVAALLNVGRVRVLAAILAIKAITFEKSRLTGEAKIKLEFTQDKAPAGNQLQKIWQQSAGKMDFKLGKESFITWKPQTDILAELENLLHRLASIGSNIH